MAISSLGGSWSFNTGMMTGNLLAGVSVLANAVTVLRFRRWSGSWGLADASACLRRATEVQAEEDRQFFLDMARDWALAAMRLESGHMWTGSTSAGRSIGVMKGRVATEHFRNVWLLNDLS
jgi:hypothetical protein